ncbi:MAG TPA: hypothetical protein VLV83_04970 [Acidobacteriota bacterium]|nr:hypothetical protein [Acidobacteriota bacterium]
MVLVFQATLAAAQSRAELLFQDGNLQVLNLAPEVAGEAADSAEWCARLLGVWAGDRIPRPEEKLPQVGGRCRVQEGKLFFDPRYPWTPGVSYVAHWRLSGDGAANSAGSSAEDNQTNVLTFSIPKPALPKRTRVTAIHPGSDALPMNLLRIYIQFSHSMSRGQAYHHIRLVDDQGQTIPHAFLDLRPELWDPSTRRFTLLFDPGRIKRGLEPHKQLGLPLYPDRSYRLVIDAGWEDGRGVPLREGAEKAFIVTVPDRTSPQPDRWRLDLPAPGTRDPLRVRFAEPLDHALAMRLIQVEQELAGTMPSNPRSNDGSPAEGSSTAESGTANFGKVSGRVEMLDNDRIWTFHPDSPWQSGNHRLSIGAWLEDLAGNNLNRPFDYDLESRQQIHEQERVYVTFQIAP